MKYLDEFRCCTVGKTLIEQIRHHATRRWVLMDVCGGQTHGLVRYGIEQELEGCIELIHGPGCPVCVTSIPLIDFAIDLSTRPGVILASFGDMIRVPGSHDSLNRARGRGGNVKIVYSPVDAVALAAENPDCQIIFFAVGFETTVPATALAVLQADRLGLTNFFVVPSHVRVLPAMEAIMEMPDNRVEGFLAAGHVCSITGHSIYDPFVDRYQIPVVVTGFQPIDLLRGILRCVQMLEQGTFAVRNCYGRSVRRNGSRHAQSLIDRVYVAEDRDWRGFGRISGGGYCLREEFKRFDASARFAGLETHHTGDTSRCRGSDVMSGKIKPKQCPEFGVRCTPEAPLGAPMVSSEGACAAYYRFDPLKPEKS